MHVIAFFFRTLASKPKNDDILKRKLIKKEKINP
jgi:hypothetical protein